MPRRPHAPAPLPRDARIVVPVMGAVGGSGRSTTAALLAGALAARGSTAVLDTAPRLTSPWPSWAVEAGTGLAAVPPDQPFTRGQLLAAASRCASPPGRGWHVLTDHQEWSGPLLPLPAEPAAWYQLAAAGGWQAVVTDTVHPAGHDTVAARRAGHPGLSAGWCALPCAVPVLCAAATGPGVRVLQTAVMAFSAAGLPLQRAIVVFVGTGEGRAPAAVRAASRMLRPMVSAVLGVPFDPHIRAFGMREPERLKSRTAKAGERLAEAVIASLHATWGTPLPPAPLPAVAPNPAARPCGSAAGLPGLS
ncbi:hypothetical protein KBZ10_09570 [Streptomyces sp. F63]|uniref:hypothetical protein n=1 Tax=Streptomyces sp. F63 TaxID=2824887 RepID=UPI001B35A0AD|nr:hypothetical protein [Streptomyces sp. F63]MBQ0984761.1 hypothetical protein [Streptomyces sp. F63]